MNIEESTVEYETNFRDLHVRYKKLFKKIVVGTVKSSEEFCLSDSQAIILLYITNHSPCSMGDIHKHSPLTKGAVTQIIDCFENRKLIERIHSLKDRRSVLVNITKEGSQLGHNIEDGLVKQLHLQLNKLDNDEKITLIDSLRNINQLLDKMGSIDD